MTTDKNPIQTVENHPLEAFEMLKQMQNSQPHAAPDNDDPVNNPFHYQSLCKDGIDCITAMRHAFGDDVVAAFCKCNAMKYIWRESSKGGNESIQKAIWYLNKYLELNK